MPTNAELSGQIQSLDPTYPIDGLNNAQLGAALKKCKSTQTELINRVKELSPEAQTDGLDIAGLKTVLESVDTEENRKAAVERKEAANNEATTADKEKADKAAAVEAEKKAAKKKVADKEKAVAKKAKNFPYSVKVGKSVTSKKGVIGEGEEIKAEYLGGGQNALDALVKSGHVAKNKK